MAKVIIYTTENGNVAVCYPTGELPIEEVLAKDCPAGAMIVNDSELPTDNEYFNAWELVDGKVGVNLDKKNIMILEKETAQLAKQSALNKLMALGLTEEEALALGVK